MNTVDVKAALRSTVLKAIIESCPWHANPGVIADRVIQALYDQHIIIVVEMTSGVISLCGCENPVKVYSTSGCHACWHCENCGKRGGCDNQY